MFITGGLTTLLALVLLAECAVITPASSSDAVVSWGNCTDFGVDSTNPNFQCGFLEVPMDYHDSSAGMARLAVIKYAATVTEKKGTIFFNPGGPGGSGIEFIAGSGQTLSEDFQGTYDLVSWDPRGVGLYTFPGAVTCFDSSEDDAAFWNNTVASYINETISGRFNERDLEELYSQVDLTEEKFKDFTRRCQNGPVGPYLEYVGTSSTVRDLVSLGDALVGKDEPIDYWGISYGTILGFNFVNMFPERAGHVILDGVGDSDSWISYKWLHPSLADSEKTYSGLTDACAAAGRAGCKLIEFIDDDASGDDVKALLNNAHDAALQLYRDGVQVPIVPGLFKLTVFTLLFTPPNWSFFVNGPIYKFVAFVLQASQAHNVTIDGSAKYNVPSEEVATDETAFESFLSGASDTSSQNLTSHALEAISGADDFNDDNTTIKDVFDIIVNNTREVTPTFGTVWTLGYNIHGWPVHSVERLPLFSPKKLKNPVLVMGNTADPITPFASAEKIASMLGDNAFLLEQLGFGHTTRAQVSNCTTGVATNYFANSELPEGRTIQCPVDDTNLFPDLGGNTSVARRSNFLRRW